MSKGLQRRSTEVGHGPKANELAGGAQERERNAVLHLLCDK
jgi:hypothetical protein